MKLRDTFLLAFRTIRSNKLRTGLTVAIIAFGIMALVGIITAIEAMNQKFTESFSTMGANGFTIRYKERNIHIGGDGAMRITASFVSTRPRLTLPLIGALWIAATAFTVLTGWFIVSIFDISAEHPRLQARMEQLDERLAGAASQRSLPPPRG